MSVSRRLGLLLALLAVAKGQTSWTPVTVGSAASGGVRWIVRGETSRAAGSARVFEEATAAHSPSSPPTSLQDSPAGSGACGYGTLSASSWPYDAIAVVNPDSPFLAGSAPQGCGTCLEIQCTDEVGSAGCWGQLGSVAQGVCKA